MKKRVISICLHFALILISCKNDFIEYKNVENKTRHIIIDTDPVAEFNVFADALAYKTMLDLNVPTTIIGLDVCLRDATWTSKDFETLSESGSIGEFVNKSFTEQIANATN